MKRVTENIYTFTALDMAAIVMQAGRLEAGKLAANTPSRKRASRLSELALNIVGVMGEYCVAKVLRVAMDTGIYPARDDGHDMRFNGYTVQVKATTFTGKEPNLIIDNEDHLKSDLIYHVQVYGYTNARLLGWITDEAFRAKHATKNFGYGERLYVLHSDLNTPDTIFNLAPRRKAA